MTRMKWDWAAWIVRSRKGITRGFLALAVLSALAACLVIVNYDLTKYLPESSDTSQGLGVMEDEFGYPGTARLMLEDVSLYEANAYKNQVESVDGVAMVMWLDTLSDVYQSELFLGTEEMQEYYRDGSALMHIIFAGDDYDKTTSRAIEEIRSITGDRGRMMGSAVQAHGLSGNLSGQMAVTVCISVVLAFAVLALSTTSWLEPVLFLAVMGMAIVINMGTNIFMGQVSFLTFSLASILQMAIAMDYSVFLLHAFTREREKGLEPEEAMRGALRGSLNSILSSGATTVVGFLALVFMQFTIGADIGIVLAKGIIISLVTVLVFMPALILKFYPLVEKLRHRSFMPSFRKLGRAVLKVRYVVLGLVAVLVIPAFTAQNMNQFNYGSSALGAGEGTQVYEDEQVINEKFGESNMLIALTPRGSGEDAVLEQEFTARLQELPVVDKTLSLQGLLPEGVPESFLPNELVQLLHTERYSRVLVYVSTPLEGDEAFACADEIKAEMERFYPEHSHLLGLTTATMDIRDTIVKDYSVINMVSILGVAIVILLAYRNLAMSILLVAPILVAVYFNMALPYVAGEELMYIGYIIISCLQLGATVDYSILLAGHYRQARRGRDRRNSVIHAVSKSALSILTSGIILSASGYGLYLVSDLSAIAGMGRLIGRGALICLLLVLFLTPALLYLFDRLIIREKRGGTGGWNAWRKRIAPRKKPKHIKEELPEEAAGERQVSITPEGECYYEK
ncbi:MAG: MMPL family transporter [Clostridiales bacterium]|nr:MMPL family transporter [Clostridiales bacterium]